MDIRTGIYSKIRRKAGYVFHDLRGRLGLNEKLFRDARGSRIVVYHGICRADPTRFNSLFLTLKTFEEHLQFYRRYFNIVSLDAYYRQEFSKDRFNLCISFDDGFANNYNYALPLMEKYGAPAAFFITGIREAGYDFLWNDLIAFLRKYGPEELSLGKERYKKDNKGNYCSMVNGRALRDELQASGFEKKAEMIRLLEPVFSLTSRMSESDYWLQMTAREIKALSASPLATIGCHGYYHNDLGKIPPDDAKKEMIRSRQYLEEITGKEIKALAFPYGSYTRAVVEEARSLGFGQLLALDFSFPEDRADPTLRERMVVNPFISVTNQMTAIVYGKYR